MSSFFRRRKSDEEEPTNFGLARVFKHEELKKATNSFATELGIGGFGTVYLGTLRDGQKVAVKLLHNNNPKRLKEFMTEVMILSNLHHENLVILQGCTNPRGAMRPTMEQVLTELKQMEDELQEIGGLNGPWQELEDSLIGGGKATIEDPDNGASIYGPSIRYLRFHENTSLFFDIEDVLGASSEKMGKGRLGTTYRSTLESGPAIIVKRLTMIDALCKNEFKNEFSQQMELLGRVNHENLVEIIAFYNSGQEKLIIYKDVFGASLYTLLHDYQGVGEEPLNWAARLSIVKGMASGLAHLYNALPSPEDLHINLKSSSVLVVQSNHFLHRPAIYRAKLTDFGFLPVFQSPQDKIPTRKDDIYCFGVVLFEVITGQVPDEEDLSQWVTSALQNYWTTGILDLEIAAEIAAEVSAYEEEMHTLIKIALECTSAEPEGRPEMSELLQMMGEIGEPNNEENKVGKLV